jgi:opacity protein-like surface antigen
VKSFTAVSVGIAAVLLGCSANSSQPSSTTVDPIVAELQKKVDELQEQVNSTTPSSSTTTTEAPKPARVKTDSGSYNIGKRGFGSNVEYGCRDYDNYSDGTVEITREYWITEDAYDANNGC